MSRPAHIRLVPHGADEPDDKELLRRCAGGDEEAARAFVQRHQPSVVRFLARMLGVWDPAVDDVAQDALLASLDGAGRYEGRSSARTWVLGIAHNKAKMAIRTASRRRRAMDLLATLRLVERRRSPQPEDADVGRRIEAAVQTLDPDRRAVFILTDVEGRTSREAAAILGAPEGTVRRWRTEARLALRPHLADLDPGGAA